MLGSHVYSPFLLALLVDVYEEDGGREKRDEAVKVCKLTRVLPSGEVCPSSLGSACKTGVLCVHPHHTCVNYPSIYFCA